MLRGFVRDFYENTLQGALSPFVAYLAEESEVSDEQIDELKQLVSDLERKRGDRGKAMAELILSGLWRAVWQSGIVFVLVWLFVYATPKLSPAVHCWALR